VNVFKRDTGCACSSETKSLPRVEETRTPEKKAKE